MLHNRPILKSRRKELRNNATPAEQLLWSILQHSNLGGYKFRRQHSVGPYILDFYCPAERLAVELDGDSHFTDDAIVYDCERTAYLNGLGIKVIRFLNTDVYDNPHVVCERILAEIEDENLATPTNFLKNLKPLLPTQTGTISFKSSAPRYMALASTASSMTSSV